MTDPDPPCRCLFVFGRSLLLGQTQSRAGRRGSCNSDPNEPASVIHHVTSDVGGSAGSVARSAKSVKSISCFLRRCWKTYFREPPKINGVALVIKAGFRALLAGREDGDVAVRAPRSSPRRACLSHHGPLRPACPVMSRITCSVVGTSCVRRLHSIFVL